MTPGIYQILNLINGRSYVGSSCVCVFWRVSSHIRELRNNRHKNTHLQRAWNRYGEGSFCIRVLEVMPSWIGTLGKPTMRSYVERREQSYIDLNVRIGGYNLCPVVGSRFGSTMSEDAKEKIGKAFRGKPLSQSHKDKIREANLGQGRGRKLPKEVCEKMSHSRKGRKLPDSVRNKISESRKGMKFSDDHRKNLSEAQIRRYRS